VFFVLILSNFDILGTKAWATNSCKMSDNRTYNDGYKTGGQDATTVACYGDKLDAEDHMSVCTNQDYKQGYLDGANDYQNGNFKYK
jgi:hypothetical protein